MKWHELIVDVKAVVDNIGEIVFGLTWSERLYP